MIVLEGEITCVFYVYELWGLQDTHPFYVGKGKEDRYKDHIKRSFLNRDNNIVKVRKIHKLIKQDGYIKAKIVFNSNDENETNLHEIKLITTYGKLIDKTGILTNIMNGGDGGPTIQGRKMFHNPVTNEHRFLLPEEQIPNGFVKGKSPNTIKQLHTYYDPDTLVIYRFGVGEKVPCELVPGMPTGIYGFGPKQGFKVYNNGEHKIYLQEGKAIPEGYTPGKGYSSTKDRIRYWNPQTGVNKYLPSNTNPPQGFIKGGSPSTTNKQIQTETGKVFSSISAACSYFNITRYEVNKRLKENKWQMI